KDPAEGAVRETFEVLDGARELDLEPFPSRVGNHVSLDVHALGLDAGLAQEQEELAATAAEIDHGRCSAEVLDVAALLFSDELGGTAHPAFVGEVVGKHGLALGLSR